MRILGIDPGLRSTGFGVIDILAKQAIYVVSGVITTISSDSLDTRLKAILEGMTTIIKDTKPDVASIEQVFVNKNPKSSLMLGHARGVAIAACVLHDLPVAEYTALRVKQAVVGYGHADKVQVAKMVERLLKLPRSPKADAADALAVAITHSATTIPLAF